jgi:hypothetical protein
MKTLLALTGLFVGVHYWYVLAMAAKSARDAGQLTKYWTVILAPPVYGGVIFDFLFQFTFGWVMFVETPFRGGWLFSGRVQYHYSNGEGWRLELAKFWARTLRVFDPNHIR